MLKKTLFNSVIYKGTLGAVYGIVAGLILGLLVWSLLQVSITIENVITPGLNASQTGVNANPPFVFINFFGMGFGAVIGGIFGALTALKEGKR